MAITRAQQVRQMYKEGSKKPVVQGGVDNYLGDQPQVVVPRNWQSGPDKPPTELAYITEAEKKLLLKEDRLNTIIVVFTHDSFDSKIRFKIQPGKK